MTPVVSEWITKFEDILTETPEALSTLISELHEWGTPIVERLEGYHRYVWVTHFYVAPEDVKQVALFEDHIGFNVERAQMQQIANTNLFAKTTIVPYGHQLSYAFSLNDPLQGDWQDRVAHLVSDPMNPYEEREWQGIKLSVTNIPTKEEYEELEVVQEK